MKPILTVSFISGDISLMNNYDDLSPNIIHSGLKGKRPCYVTFIVICVNDGPHLLKLICFCSTDVEVQWCSQGDLLAVAGMERHGLPSDSACSSMMRNALVKFYNVQGEHIYTLETPAQVNFQSFIIEHISFYILIN